GRLDGAANVQPIGKCAGRAGRRGAVVERRAHALGSDSHFCHALLLAGAPFGIRRAFVEMRAVGRAGRPNASAQGTLAILVLDPGCKREDRIEDTFLEAMASPQHPWVERNLREGIYNIADENIRYFYN